jgi:hypothetical protein
VDTATQHHTQLGLRLDERAPASDGHHQSFIPQDVERTANGSSRHAVLLLELALTRHRVTRLYLARLDHLTQDNRQLLVQRRRVQMINSHAAKVSGQVKQAICQIQAT